MTTWDGPTGPIDSSRLANMEKLSTDPNLEPGEGLVNVGVEDEQYTEPENPATVAEWVDSLEDVFEDWTPLPEGDETEDNYTHALIGGKIVELETGEEVDSIEEETPAGTVRVVTGSLEAKLGFQMRPVRDTGIVAGEEETGEDR